MTSQLSGMFIGGARGAAVVVVFTALAGGVGGVARAGLAALVGGWCALVAPAPAPVAAAAGALAALREAVIGATLGVVAAVPVLAASIAGRLAAASGGRRGGPTAPLFAVVGAAVFVGLDGHVALLRAVLDSRAAVPVDGPPVGGGLAGLAALVPGAVRIAAPWLVAGAVVELGVGAAARVAGRGAPAGVLGTAPAAASVALTAWLLAAAAVGMAAMLH